MRIAALARTLGFQLAVAMSLLIVAVGALVVWQVDDLLRNEERGHFADHLLRSRTQIAQQLTTDRDLVATGAVVLANQPDMRAAIESGDIVAILQISTDYYNRTGPTLQGAAGLQVYDAEGRLLVRAHDPLRGRQAEVPVEVRTVIETGTSLGVPRIDELIGAAVVGISPVFDDSGQLVGVIEAMTSLDMAYLEERERLMDVEIALISDTGVISAHNALPLNPAEIDRYMLEEAPIGDVTTIDIGGEPYLATFLPLTAFDGTTIASIYLGVGEDEIFASVQAVRMATLRATALGAFVALGLSVGLAIVAVRPIRGLVEAAGRIQANDLDTPVAVNGPTEVTALGRALDNLRLAIRQTREAMLNVNRDIATQFQRSSESLTEVTQELSAMHSILGALSSDSPEGLAGVTEHLTELGWVDGAVVAVADEEGHLSVASSFGLTPAAGVALLQVIEAGVGTQQLEQGMMVRDAASARDTARLLPLEIGGFAVEPVVEPDGIAGAIVITSINLLELSDSRRDLLRAVAREIALTLERTELASAVEESRRIAESVLREMSDGVLVLDQEGRCVAANPAAERLLGLPRQALLGRFDQDFLPLSEEAIETLRRRARSRAAGPVTPLLAARDGRQLAIGAGPFVGADPADAGMMVLIRDLSAEAEAERVKQDFVSMVGHELRTPLTLIRTTVDLLNEGDAGGLTDTQARIVEVLRSNTDRLMSLINDLLDMSAIDSGRMEIQPEEADLVEIVTDVVEDARPAAEAKDHHLVLRAPEFAPVWADRRRVGQVVSNLISNAVKYTPPGGSLEVTVEVDGPWAQVSVRDTGIGISPADQEQLFQRFYRTSAGRRITGGTGLGLAIARSLVELHGGQIWVDSDGDGGSTFAFTLPTLPI